MDSVVSMTRGLIKACDADTLRALSQLVNDAELVAALSAALVMCHLDVDNK